MSEPHDCRLFVRLPAGPGFEDALSAALKNPEAASLLLPAGLPEETARVAVKRIQATDRPALVIDDQALRAALQADGIHLTNPTLTRTTRVKLGDGLVLGAECPLERHACMVAAEDGADYVAVRVTESTAGEAEQLLAWWHEMMTTPIVALVEGSFDQSSLTAYADFVSPPL